MNEMNELKTHDNFIKRREFERIHKRYGFWKEVLCRRMIRILYSVWCADEVEYKKKIFLFYILKRYDSNEFSIFHGGTWCDWSSLVQNTRGSPIRVSAGSFFYFML
jgi:hypothetical protein